MTKSNLTTGGRPKANRAQIVTAISEGLIAVMACTGVWSLTHGLSVEKEQNAENAIARLYPLDVNVNQALGQTAKPRVALYDDPDGTVYRGLTDWEKGVFEDACAALGDVFEYYRLIRDNIQYHKKGKEITDSWNKYIEATCKKSYGFREYIKDNRDIWTPTFLDEFKKCTANLPRGDQ